MHQISNVKHKGTYTVLLTPKLDESLLKDGPYDYLFELKDNLTRELSI